MKIIYLCYFDLDSTKFIGVKKKIYGQVKAMNDLKHDCSIAFCSNNMLKIDDKEIYSKAGITNYRKSVYNNFKKNQKLLKCDMLYIRFPGTVDYYLYKTCKLLDKKNIKVILELPTYPLEGEYKEVLYRFRKEKQYGRLIKMLANILLNNVFSKFLKKTDCNIVTYMQHNQIWGIKPIVIDNGIDTEKIKKIKKEEKVTDTFNFVTVANIAKWHGIDRVIEGINNYVKNSKPEKIKVILHVVGEGEGKKDLEELVEKYKLNNYVKFYGLKQGKELEEIYSQANIAVGSLGLHRIGLYEGSTLKIKEYCAFGIPFILSYKEREIDDKFKYALQLENNDSPVDIKKCIEFYNQLDEDYQENMNVYAKEKYDWKIQMEKILEK